MNANSTGRPNRKPEPNQSLGEGLLLGAVLAVVLIALLTWAAGGLAGAHPGANPIAYLLGLATGGSTWPTTAWAILVGFLVLLATLAGLTGWMVHRARGGGQREWVDAKAEVMATSRELAPLREPAVAASSRELGATDASNGIPLAAAIHAGVGMLYGTWEQTQLWIMGPRMGKTSCVLVPQLCSTRGPALVTSNKRDVLDLTYQTRAGMGACWVFDPQGIARTSPAWWWNPLDYVQDLGTARKFANLANAAVSKGDRGDAYFEPEGIRLVADLLLAAAKGNRAITAVTHWLQNPDDDTPLRLLRDAKEGPTADELASTMRMRLVAGPQGAGVWGTAEKMLAFLGDTRVRGWVTSTGPRDKRPRLRVTDFVRSRDTIYALSKEGADTSRALTAVLTLAVCEAAEHAAEAHQTGPVKQRGRLSPPLYVGLDEAANICRWPDLPDQFSHYGSKGIALAAFLQSWSQGEDTWGKARMDTLWSAANIRGLGASVADPDLLEKVSKLVGDHDVLAANRQYGNGGGGGGRGQSSISQHLRRDRILEVADLTALPPGRAVLAPSGVAPALVRLVHYSAYPWGAGIGAEAPRVAAPVPRLQSLPGTHGGGPKRNAAMTGQARPARGGERPAPAGNRPVSVSSEHEALINDYLHGGEAR